ncbi:MAG: hypothetical protein M3P98_00525 [bacterium]|nr:hypothetical protein [bacterium]
MADDTTGPIIEPTSDGQAVTTTGLTSDPNAGQNDQVGTSISVGTPQDSFTPAPVDDTANESATDQAEPTPQIEIPAPEVKPMDESPAPEPKSANKDLLAIKQSALKELSPLVDELDLPPDEEFKTLLMMIQSGDNKDLIPKAHEVANKIEDKHERAEALLDIVNEINYFTQE